MDHHRLSVEREISADPSTIFAILSDASRHSEIDGSGTVREARGSREPLSLGSVFGMSMKMGLPYTTKNTVIEHEPDRRIAWQTTGLGGVIGGRIWRYELEPVEGGTRVRESWDITQETALFKPLVRMGGSKSKKNMEATLERIERIVR